MSPPRRKGKYRRKKGTLKREVANLQRRINKKPEKPCTYVIEAVGVNKVKIGKTRSLDKRLATLQAASPCRLILLRKIEGEHHEKVLHRELAEFREHGEWFRKTTKLVDYLNRYHRSDPNFCYLDQNAVQVNASFRVIVPKSP